MKLLKMSNFTFFHYVFYAICILKSFNSHISVVVCSFFELGIVSKWCIRELIKTSRKNIHCDRSLCIFLYMGKNVEYTHSIKKSQFGSKISWTGTVNLVAKGEN